GSRGADRRREGGEMARAARDGGRGVAVGIGLVVAMVLLVALAVGAHRSGLILLLLLAVAAAGVAARAPLPQAPLLWLTSGLCSPLSSAVYAPVLAPLFRHVSPLTAFAAYVLPLAAFNGSLAWRRAEIVARLARPRAEHGPTLARGLLWLALSAGVGGLAQAALPPDPSAAVQNLALLLTMAALAVLAVLFTPDITLLLTETGLLFRTFTGRMAQRVVPVFSFVVVFFFVVVVFAALYAILDRFATAANFRGRRQQPRDDVPRGALLLLHHA